MNNARMLKGRTQLESSVIRAAGREVDSATGDPELTLADRTAIKAMMDDLPVSVDNSKLMYFPPIRYQGSLNSCTTFAVVYTQLSYMVALQKGLDITDSGDNSNKYSPKWAYNMANSGVDEGSSFSNVYDLIHKCGAATWAEFPYDTDYREWCLDTPAWLRALGVRTEPVELVRDVRLPEIGLAQIKELLTNGMVLTFGTYINSWRYKQIEDDPSTSEDDAAIGKSIAFWLEGNLGLHAMAIVGYNDAIWVDINGNGAIDPGEKGALRIANSWGTTWNSNDGGFIWLSYDALKPVSGVPDGPATNRVAAVVDDSAYRLTVKQDYSPSVIAEFQINHGKRGQMGISLGISSAAATTPDLTWTPVPFYYQGGPYAFNGSTTAVDGTFVLDFTDLMSMVTEPERFYLKMTDNTSGDEATLWSFKIVDMRTVPNGMEYSRFVPLKADASMALAYLDYPHLNQITVTSPNGSERWLRDDDVPITWTTEGLSGAVRIAFSTDRGLNWSTIASSAPNTGRYLWRVPDRPSATCLVRVYSAADPSIFDMSDTLFSIITERAPWVDKAGEWDTIQVNSVWAQGKYVYCGTGTYGYFALDIIDVSDPSRPNRVGHFPTTGYANGVCVNGKLAYLADGYSGLLIINVSIPESPAVVGVYDTPGYATDIIVQGHYAYVLDADTALSDSGLLILDITDPASPVLVGSSTSPHFSTEIFVSGRYAYITENLGGLRIFDVSDPGAPALVGTYVDSWSDSRGVFVSGKFAYVADQFYGLLIIDISDPSSPSLVSRTHITSANCVYVNDRFAFVAAANNGVYMLDVSNPASPSLVTSYDTPGSAIHVVATGGYAYVADGSSLVILNVNDPPRTDLLESLEGQGVYCRNSDTETWSRLASTATLIAGGDLDGDGVGDLAGIWPAQGGVWIRSSLSGNWIKLSSTARHIGVGDMNGDGRDDLVGTWDGQGTFYRDSASGAWVKLASPANLVTAGDLDGDGIDDLIGTWPGQGGIWVKYSSSLAWVRLSSTARDIAAGDMNGDGRADLVGTWDGQGTYYRDSVSGAWIKVASPAEQTACGDIDGDGIADLLGIWPSQGGVWVKYSGTQNWERLSLTAVDIVTARMRSVGTETGQAGEALTSPFGGIEPGPEGAANAIDISQTGPGGREFRFREEKNLEPGEAKTERAKRRLTPGPGEPEFESVDQKNIFPKESIREKKNPEETRKRSKTR